MLAARKVFPYRSSSTVKTNCFTYIGDKKFYKPACSNMHFYMFWFLDVFPFLVSSPAVYQGWGLHLAGSSPAGCGCLACGWSLKDLEAQSTLWHFHFQNEQNPQQFGSKSGVGVVLRMVLFSVLSQNVFVVSAVPVQVLPVLEVEAPSQRGDEQDWIPFEAHLRACDSVVWGSCFIWAHSLWNPSNGGRESKIFISEKILIS